MDTWVTIRLGAEVLEVGTLSVPLHAMRDIARVLPAGALCLEDGSRQVHSDLHMPTLILTRDDLRFEIEGLPDDEFPRPQAFEVTHETTVPARILFQLFGATGHAVSREETRPLLNGVQWETHDGRLVFCATNGHRLATMEVPVDTEAMPEMIVTPKAFQAAQKIFPADSELRVTRSAERVAFEAAGHRVVSRLIEGPYPKWRQIMPQESNHVATFDRRALQKALERALVVGSRHYSQRVVLFLGATDPAEAWLSCWSDAVGKYGERLVLAEPLEGPELTIGLNAGYMIELLKRIPTTTVRVSFIAPERAVLLEPVGGDAPSLTCLLMPLRLQEEPLEIPWQRSERRAA